MLQILANEASTESIVPRVPALLEEFGETPAAGPDSGKLLSFMGFSKMIDAAPMLLASVWYRNLHDDDAREAIMRRSQVALTAADPATSTL
jgi:hypothetical protein